MKKGERIFSVLSLPVDFVMLLAAGVVAYLVRTRVIAGYRPVLFDAALPRDRYILLVIIVSLIFLLMYALSGLYSLRTTRRMIHEFSRIVIASSAGIMTVIIYIFLRQALFNSRFLVLAFWGLAIIFVAAGRLVLRAVQKIAAARYDFGIHRVLLIGNDSISKQLVDEIGRDPAAGYRIVRQLIDPNVQEVRLTLAHNGIDEILLANPNYPQERILELIDFCNEHHLVFRFVPNIHQILTANFAFDNLSGLPVIELKRTALDGWGQVAKRGIDIIGSLFGLIILSPLFLLIALIITIDSRGPVLVGLKRVSRNKSFKLYKFRSMIKDAEQYKGQLLHLNERDDGPLFKIKNDPRVTRIGRILRKYRIDELPQLWNVLRGEISLVGPRPHQPDEVARYQKHHKRVLAIKAGITGMAQISGSSDLPFEEEVSLDSLYIENWTLVYDLKILLLTFTKLLRDHSAV